MKSLRIWINTNTLVSMLICLASSWICLDRHWALKIDFMLISLMIFFPLTIGIRFSFKRREAALRNLARYRASLLAITEALSISKLDQASYEHGKSLVMASSNRLFDRLAHPTVQRETEALDDDDGIPSFLQVNRKGIKGSNLQKLLLFHAKTREMATSLLSIKRHGNPVGLRPFMLLCLIAFFVFYPSALLADVGFDVPLWYVYAMTAFKGLLLSTLYNIQTGMEDPFLPHGLDAIRLSDYKLRDGDFQSWSTKGKNGQDDEEDAL
jgi:hypothetical protein